VELTLNYDDRVLSAAASTLFLHRWHPFFPWQAIGLTALALLTGAICLYVRGPIEIALIFLSLGILDVIAWLALFAWQRARVMSRSGEVARVLMGEHLVRFESSKGAAEFPWKDITEIEVGLVNVVLFVSRGAGIILPTCAIPVAAMEIIERKRREIPSPSERSDSQLRV
jgi:hypothetical protein